LRGALVVVELALSLVVLMGAGLLIQSFTRLLRIEPGFVSENLVTTHVVVARYQDPQRRATVVRDIVERLEQIPGVQAAGGGTGLPPQTAQRATRYEVDGQAVPPSGAPFAYFLAITPNYFRALGTPFIAGRFFNERDVAGAPGVVIINKSLARLYFPDGNAVGQRLRLINPEQSNELRTIVGVVGDVRYSGLDDPGEAAIYTPFMQTPFPWSYLMIRGTGASLNAGAIRAAISSVAPELEATRVQTMQQLVTHSVAQPRFYTLLLSGFAAVALILAGVGLYGVLAYGVTQRTHEIGIRMALGAQRRDVLALVVRQGMVFTLIGVVIGLGASFALTRLMANLLFGVSATDTTTFAIVALLLAGVALLACYVPARRAMKVDPIVALRYE
jgi:putative ABC transport system permease protein